MGWKLLTTLPREELDRVDDAILDKYYEKAKGDVISSVPENTEDSAQ